jgi:hypothetical protein
MPYERDRPIYSNNAWKRSTNDAVLLDLAAFFLFIRLVFCTDPLTYTLTGGTGKFVGMNGSGGFPGTSLQPPVEGLVHVSQEVLVVGNRHKAKITGCRLRGKAVGLAFHICTEAIAYKNISRAENHRSESTIRYAAERPAG